MQYTYEFEIIEENGLLVALPFGMQGGTEGKDWEEVALMAAEWLKMDIEYRLMNDLDIPKPSFKNKAERGGTLLVVSVDVSLEGIDTVSASEAARMLGVSPSRVTHLIRDGLLESYRDGHSTFVTKASIQARLSEPRKAGRPKKIA